MSSSSRPNDKRESLSRRLSLHNTATPPPSSSHLEDVVALSFYAILGETIRIIFGELFGLACHKPGTVGWNEGQWMPCTTAPGTTSATGGALFTDLPANLLGCFLMGLFVSGEGDNLKLPVDLPVAMFRRNSKFQMWQSTHLGIRTGLCGCLTTFASWNAQMVVMICAGEGTALGTQWVSALFGYVVGLMVALQSFHVGSHIAVMIHRLNNPDLAQEADRLAKRKSVILHKSLPDLERRYLYDLEPSSEPFLRPRQRHNSDSSSNDSLLSLEGNESRTDHLRKWKEQTHPHRMQQVHEGGSFLQELHEIEHVVLVEQKTPNQELLEVARNAGWEVSALQAWNEERRDDSLEFSSTNAPQQRQVWIFRVYLVTLIVVTALLVWGTIACNDKEDPVQVTYRTSFLSTLLAPFGCLLRWRLSRWNTSHPFPSIIPGFKWIPVGTFAVNMMGCAISSLMVAISLRVDSHWASVTLDAVKTGFAGSLSTVSTWVVEVEALLQDHLPQHAYGYYYLLLSLVGGFLVGVVCYVWAVV